MLSCLIIGYLVSGKSERSRLGTYNDHTPVNAATSGGVSRKNVLAGGPPSVHSVENLNEILGRESSRMGSWVIKLGFAGIGFRSCKPESVQQLEARGSA